MVDLEVVKSLNPKTNNPIKISDGSRDLHHLNDKIINGKYEDSAWSVLPGIWFLPLAGKDIPISST